MTESNLGAPGATTEFIDGLFHICVMLIAHENTYDGYSATLRALFEHDPEAPPWPAVLAIARSVWTQTPHPAEQYACPSLPTNGRNDPCPCGSGLKFKRCCLGLEHSMAMPNANFLPILLDCMPKTRWPELAASRVSLDRVVDSAVHLADKGRSEDICKLLEPWFADDAGFIAKREPLFDLLLGAYDDADHPRKKTRLLKRGEAVGDARVQSSAKQRRVAIAADRGDFKEAWRLFHEAMRLDPDAVSLSHLEVTTLLAEGCENAARERASFWVHRLSIRKDPDLEKLVAFLRNVAERGRVVLGEAVLGRDEGTKALLEGLAQAPAAASCYELDSMQDSAGPMKPAPALAKALDEWQHNTPVIGHSPLFDPVEAHSEDMRQWLVLLQTKPVLWNAFEVLDVLVETLQREYGELANDLLIRPLLERAEALLHAVLKANDAEGQRLEWGWLENRPALNLLGQRILLDEDELAQPQNLARLEWLIYTLNPDDNQGFRNLLMGGYLEAPRLNKALTLAEHFPDDFASMRYDTALALYGLGDFERATAVLEAVYAMYPKPLDWLLKKNPKPMDLEGPGIRLGGDDEAWLYRCDRLALWQRYDALGWLEKFKRAR